MCNLFTIWSEEVGHLQKPSFWTIPDEPPWLWAVIIMCLALKIGNNLPTKFVICCWFFLQKCSSNIHGYKKPPKKFSISHMERHLISPAAIFWTVTSSASSCSWHVAPGGGRPFPSRQQAAFKARPECPTLTCPASTALHAKEQTHTSPFWLTNTLVLSYQEQFLLCCRISKCHQWHWHNTGSPSEEKKKYFV